VCHLRCDAVPFFPFFLVGVGRAGNVGGREMFPFCLSPRRNLCFFGFGPFFFITFLCRRRIWTRATSAERHTIERHSKLLLLSLDHPHQDLSPTINLDTVCELR